MKCIVSTMTGRGVAFTYPTLEIMSILTNGGAPEGYFGRIDWDEQVHRFVGAGVSERVAVRWTKCVRSGGLTTAEAYELIRDKDTRDYTGQELWDLDDVPKDRWYRDAWTRSHNGGPLSIDLERARPIQFKHIRSCVKLRADDIDPFECDMTDIRRRIKAATCEPELRSIWPEGLGCGV